MNCCCLFLVICPLCRSRCWYTWRTGFTHWWRFYTAVRMQTQTSNGKSSICILVSTAKPFRTTHTHSHTVQQWMAATANGKQCMHKNKPFIGWETQRAWKHFRKYVWINTIAQFPISPPSAPVFRVCARALTSRDTNIANYPSVHTARRYHNTKMVNYDVQNGFSVSSIFLQSEDHFISNTNLHQHQVAPSQQHQQQYIGANGSDARTIINQNSTLNKNTVTSKSKKLPFLVTPSISILTIKEVNFLHVGNYTCAPSNAKQASITVHVLRGNLHS